ncbi:MAG: glycosyl hydrolase [Dysgonamonadaceae bacterium]|nr:glycosyl hydrolase [Dysgonamonadaceae bacterium]
MKRVKPNIFVIILISISILFSSSNCSIQNQNSRAFGDQLQTSFVTPPDTIQTSVYWYWISDNISKEGVVKDLQAMKKVGINRAFIGNIGIEDLPFGKVKILTEEWWDILHTALKTATELNIEIGIFNSPGWSQSGGPWVKPEQSMRYLASSETTVTGPKKFVQKLDKPQDIFQDVKVLAWPVKKKNQIINNETATIATSPAIKDINKAFDGDKTTGITFSGNGPIAIDIDSKDNIIIRNITIETTNHPITAKCQFQVKMSGSDEYKTIKEFDINRSNPALNVGFIPYAPISVSTGKKEAKTFRLIFTNISNNSGITEIALQSTPRIESFSEKTLAKMWPTPLPYWDAYLWPDQAEIDDSETVVRADDIIDLSNQITSDGTLSWDVPAGEWIIMRTGMTPTKVTNAPASPEGTGLEIDKMSKEHIQSHFDAFIGQIIKRIPEKDRKCFKVVVQDSYETGGQNFTDGFIKDFKQRYNYDPTPFLPTYYGYVVNNEKESDRFLWDMRRFVADKVAYDYVGGLRDASHKYGLKTWLENYGHWGFPSEFLMYGGQSDEIGGEFWSEGDLGNIENRAATSAGHIYGKSKISAESNTAGGPAYSRYPAMMKQRNDRFFAEGINNTLLHVYISQPYEDKNPGVNAWFGNEFDRKNTWFSQLDVYIQYLKRVNYMLQQGLNVADAAYFIGEDTPKMTGIVDPSLPIGYQFDYINAEVIEKYMTVKNGLLTLPHGTQYKILVLPKQETMRPELLKKIEQLILAGGVVMGPAPKRSPSLENQPEADKIVQDLSKKLWDNVDGVTVKYRKAGKGMILNGMTMEDAFKLINCVPDCKLPEDNTIHYGHRTLKNGTEIYFISNQTNEQKVIYPEFRVRGLQPELWDATNGNTRKLKAYESFGQSTKVPIKLAPFESAFIVFRGKISKTDVSTNIEVNYPDMQLISNISSNWKITFDPSQRGPVKPILIDTLKDWTTFSDDLIKYYSGTAVYENTFNIDSDIKDSDIIMDLGNLTAMGKVYINDEYAGGVWTQPYRLNISKLVKPGTNTLKIEIVNNWMNRIIGDQQLPKNQRKTWSFVNPYNAQSKLQPSGLFGPVNVHSVKY